MKCCGRSNNRRQWFIGAVNAPDTSVTGLSVTGFNLRVKKSDGSTSTLRLPRPQETPMDEIRFVNASATKEVAVLLAPRSVYDNIYEDDSNG